MIKKLETSRDIIEEKFLLNKENHEVSKENYSSTLKNIKGFYQ